MEHSHENFVAGCVVFESVCEFLLDLLIGEVGQKVEVDLTAAEIGVSGEIEDADTR